jgi:sugar phosphate isomerase/epimerase
MIEIAVNTDNFRSECRPTAYALDWASQNGLDKIELTAVNGEDFYEGLGFSPAISLNCDALALQRAIEKRGLSVSQLDCSYGIHRWEVIPYMINGIKVAHSLKCPYIDVTDGAEVPENMSLDDEYNRAIYHIGEALPYAKSYGVGINIEPHGPLTQNVELMIKMMKHFNDPLIGINFDTGNSFVAGNDPVEMAEELLPWIRHFHVKDVAPELGKQIGEEMGIAASLVHVGQGINADNIKEIVAMLKARRWSGVMSLEASGENLTLKSLEWFRAIVN